MNSTLQHIAQRYSCRSFDGAMPTGEQLTAIAQAAVQSPSAMNKQGWRVIVVRDAALIRDMEQATLAAMAAMPDPAMYQRIQSRGGKTFYDAPCMVMLAIDPASPSAVLDCGIVVQTITLAAQSLGLNSLVCGLAGLAFAGSKAAEFQQRLGFPDGYAFGMAVLLGTAATTAEPHTPDLTKISWVG